MAIPQREKILTSLAGEFLVAGKLCLMGYVASLTLKNYPGVDIFVLNPKNNKNAAVQVKTIRARAGSQYYVPENIDKMSNPFVFVCVNNENSVDYYIAPAKDVAELSAEVRSDYIRKRPHVKKEQPRMLGLEHLVRFKDRWDLLDLE